MPIGISWISIRQTQLSGSRFNRLPILFSLATDNGSGGEFTFNFLRDNLGEEKGSELAKTLASGQWTHDYHITNEAL